MNATRSPLNKIICLLLLLITCIAADAALYDIVIRNGHIIDGTGSPWYSGDVAIADGRVAAVGDLKNAEGKRVIDAHGMIVAPGFIDMLGQSELTVLVDPHLPSKIFQGITTEITGEGESIAPLNDRIVHADAKYYEHYKITPDWRTLREYFARLQKQGIGINMATFVGATRVRRMVLGDNDATPNAAQLNEMRSLVDAAMRQGAVGVSTALEDPPAPYAKTEELIALAKEASRFGGIYATHMRSEGDGILQALDEAVRIGREANIPVEIWHLKVAGKRNFGRMPEIVAHIQKARESGVDITADTYAYTAWFNDLSAFVPAWAHHGGAAKLVERLKDPATRTRIRKEMQTPSTQWDNEWDEIEGPAAIRLGSVQNPALKPLLGKTVAQIARLWNKDPIDTIFDLIIQDNAYSSVGVFGMSEPDVELALLQPWVAINCDSQGTSPEGLLGQDHPHPRAYGTFPRILRKYVREENKLRLEDAIRKFSALAAQRMHLQDRGVLKQGMCANVVIFNPNEIRDLATFENPNQLSIGMQYVLVNGVPVIDEGTATNALPEKTLLGSGLEK